MRTLRAALLGLVLTLSAGAASAFAASTSGSTCLAGRPTATAKACGEGRPAPATVVTMLPLSTPGFYQLSITTSKPTGLDKLVRWSPPANMMITGITAIANGRCSLAGGRIACVATKPGRQSMAVSFAAMAAPIFIDPANSSGRRGNGDAVTMISVLDVDSGLLRLSVTNTSGLGFLNNFIWHPPSGMTVTSITNSQGGKCSLSNGNISCRAAGKGIAPPPQRIFPRGGGTMTIDVLALGVRQSQDRTGRPWSGGLQILTMTPVPWHHGGGLPRIDLRLCKKGEVSTKASPCTPR